MVWFRNTNVHIYANHQTPLAGSCSRSFAGGYKEGPSRSSTSCLNRPSFGHLSTNSPVTLSRSTRLPNSFAADSSTTIPSPSCTGSQTTWSNRGSPKLSRDYAGFSCSATHPSPEPTRPSRCSSWPTSSIRRTCRSSLQTSDENIVTSWCPFTCQPTQSWSKRPAP